MAKGFFDIVDQYNKSGYGAFQNRGYTPEEIAQMYAQAGQGRVGGGMTLHERLGANAAGFLGSLGGAVYNAVSPKAKAARAEMARQDRVGKVALEEIKTRAQEIAQERNIDPRAAMEAAAMEAFGTRYQKADKYNDVNRDTAMRIYQEAQNLKGEDKKQGTFMPKEFFNIKTGARTRVDTRDPGAMEELMGAAANEWLPMPAGSSILYKQSEQDPEKEVPYMVFEDGTIYNFPNAEDLAKQRGKIEVNVNNKDPLTEAQRGQAFRDADLAIQGYANAQDIMAMLFDEADKLPWAPGNIVGGLSILADKASGIGEFLNGVVGTSDPEEAIYQIIGPDGPRAATYKQLTNVNNPKYARAMAAFNKMAGAGQISQQLQASMIELAYMIAVAEEPSARGISDNDIERRLQTLGNAAGSKQTFMNILESARQRLKIKFKNRVDLDAIYEETDARGVKLKDKAYSVMGRYGDPNEIDPATPDAVRPDRKRPDVRPAIIPGVNY